MAQPYLSLEAELHDAFWEAEDDGSELRMIAGFLRERPGLALEVGSGSGRLMLPLAVMGFQIEGLEFSADMISLAGTRAERLGIKAAMHQGDMCTWDDGRRFTSLLAPAFTFQLAEDPVATLHHWHHLLEPGGGLYLTVFQPYAELFGDLPEGKWYPDHKASLPDGREGLLETRHRLEPEHCLLHREHRYSVSGSPPRVHHSVQTIRWFEHPVLAEMLAGCSFRMDRVFVDLGPDALETDPDTVDHGGILTYHATRMT